MYVILLHVVAVFAEICARDSLVWGRLTPGVWGSHRPFCLCNKLFEEGNGAAL